MLFDLGPDEWLLYWNAPAYSARRYGVTDTDGTQPDCWRYVVEVQDPGLPATEVGYR